LGLVFGALFFASHLAAAELPAYAPPAPVSGTLTCAGADTMHDLADDWGRDFRRFHPGATVRVRRDGKLAAEGLAAVMSGAADCALFVREPFPAELSAFRSKFGYAPTLVNVAGGSHSTKSATHAIAIYVNAANPIGALTLEQLDAIFSKTRRSGAKELTTWGQLGLGGEWAQRPIHVYGMLRRRETANPPGIVNFLEQRMLGGGEFRDDIREQPGTAAEPALDAVVHRVADDPAGIGYSGFAQARPGVKTVAIARTATSPFYTGQPEEVATRQYPLSREIYLAVDRAPGEPLAPLLREFLVYTLSREGQQVVASDRMKFIPLDAGQAATARALVTAGGGDATLAAALREGKVVVYSVLSNKAAQPLVADFNALHPGIKVEYDGEMGSTELVDRLTAETAAAKDSADVVWSSAMDLQVKLVEDGYAMSYASPEAKGLPAWALYRDLAYGTTYEPVVFIYNKERVSADEIPQDHNAFARLLDAKPSKFAGKVTAFDIEKSGVGYMFAAQDRRNFAGLDQLLRSLGKADYRPSPGTGAMLEKVTSGEYVLGYNIMGAYALVRAKREPTLGVVLPKDYTLVLSRVAFINKNARHPNAAKVWLDYLLSKRGQAVIGNRLELFAIRDDVDAEYSAAKLSRQIGDAVRPIPISGELARDLEPAKRREIIDAWNAAVAAGRR